ncbi:probable WRKY transcription factor 64 [Typha angustifolia]|uniref:probable WRKY transcription factor 64 n=1 Tax=Typha angustifolia TaxID=59011 RepID=UPI003C2FB822
MASPMVGEERGFDCEKAIEEVTRGYELTAQLKEVVRMVLKGSDGKLSEADVLLEAVMQAFRTSLSILKSNEQNLANSNGCGRDQGSWKSMLTYQPHCDGYQWRKYGSKKIRHNKYPRCYYRCTYHRECNCHAAKRVQQQNEEDPPLFLVTYCHEHTCKDYIISTFLATSSVHQTMDSSPKDSALLQPLDLRASYVIKGGGGGGEEEALVSSLANVIRSGCNGDAKPSPQPKIDDMMWSMPCMSPMSCGLEMGYMTMMIDDMEFFSS